MFFLPWIATLIALIGAMIYARRSLARLENENLRLRRYGTDFVANVSHELKTPLTSIQGYTETLKSMVEKDPAKAKEFLNRIEENSKRLSELINDLLDLSKIESPEIELEISEFSVGEVLKEIEQDFASKLESRRQVLVLKAESQNLRADRRLFEQAIMNLVENAHRYTQEGSIIEIDSRQIFEGGRLLLEISVSDNGPGIPAEDLPRIFERFYRADKSRNRERGGTGLGLAIVKHIMLSHQGIARVDHSSDKGTKFALLFPRNL